MTEYTIKAFEDQEYCTDAYIYLASDYQISKAEVAALLQAQEVLEAMWYSDVGVLVGLAAGAPQDSCKLYDSTHLAYTDGWNEIDRLSAYLVNAKMRYMCKKEDSTSLIFDAVSEDLVKLFADTFFVVGMTHVQTQVPIEIDNSGHRAADTERVVTSRNLLPSYPYLHVDKVDRGGGSDSRVSRGGNSGSSVNRGGGSGSQRIR